MNSLQLKELVYFLGLLWTGSRCILAVYVMHITHVCTHDVFVWQHAIVDLHWLFMTCRHMTSLFGNIYCSGDLETAQYSMCNRLKEHMKANVGATLCCVMFSTHLDLLLGVIND